MARRWSAQQMLDTLQSQFPDLTFPNLLDEFTTTIGWVTVDCKKHGVAKKQPHKMLTSHQGCPSCGAERSIETRRYSWGEMLQKFRKVHGDRYNYRSETFQTVMQPMTIICPEHGEFQQTPQSHYMQQSGCIPCSIARKPQNKPIDFESFVRRSREVHGTTYSYHPDGFTGACGVVSIRCQVHGEFTQNGFDHLYGSGCPSCNRGFNPKEPADFYLYQIQAQNSTYLGFGISGNMRLRDFTHQMAFDESNAVGRLLHQWHFNCGHFARRLEYLISRLFAIRSSGISGFIIESTDWEDYPDVLRVASEFHGFHHQSELQWD